MLTNYQTHAIQPLNLLQMFYDFLEIFSPNKMTKINSLFSVQGKEGSIDNNCGTEQG